MPTTRKNQSARLAALERRCLEAMTEAELVALIGDDRVWLELCSDAELERIAAGGPIPARLLHLVTE